MLSEGLEGRCLCGGVSYRLIPPTDFASHCHCQSCRQATGAPMVSWTSVAKERFELIEGGPLLRSYASSATVHWNFCGQCGTTLFYHTSQKPETIYITVASLTSALDRPLESHVSFEEKPAWLDLDGPVPRYFAKTDVPMDALHQAAESGDVERVGALLEQGLPVDGMVDGRTPLMDGADEGRVEVCRILLEHGAQASVAADNAACTRLAQTPQLLELFLEYGCDPQQLLGVVAEWSTLEAARLLLRAGANPSQPDEDGEYPLYNACKRSLAMIALMLEHGAERIALNGDGSHSLHFCARWGYARRLKALLDSGVPVDLLEHSGFTALFWASSQGKYGCAQILLEHGANPNLGAGVLTPLMLAARHGSPALVRLLLDHGADPKLLDLQGRNACDHARQWLPDLLAKARAAAQSRCAVGRVRHRWGHNSAGERILEVRGQGSSVWADGHAAIVELLKD